MSKKENEQAVEQAEQMEPETVTEEVTEGAAPETDTPDPLLSELEALKDTLAQKEDQYLRLAAEYDNYRRRSQKEKTDAYQSAKSDAVLAFLPVYDNLERALKQETADEA